MRPDERSPAQPLNAPARVLREGALDVRGRLPWSSNATFLADAGLEGESVPVVYKPLRGERPLWDYPSGLYQREVAAWVVSDALGWDLVPDTVARDDGPFGPGSVQRFVEADFSEHYFTLLERPEHHRALMALCALDIVLNSGDRKAGHCLAGVDGRVWAIDNGLCLHVEPKLRTVIWDFAGRPVPADLVAAVARLAADPPVDLERLAGPAEVEALVRRAHRLVRHPVFPPLRTSRSLPWPLV